MPKHVSPDCQDMLRRVMETNPDKRLTIAQIKKHRWYLKTHQPVCQALGLIIGKNEIPVEPSMLKYLDKFGFKADFARACLNNNKHNQVTTTYYLLHKKFEQEGNFKSGFKVESTP